MNFVSQAIPTLIQLMQVQAKKGAGRDVESLAIIINCLRTGIKFLLPEHGHVGIERKSLTDDMFEFVRLPYPVVVFEFETAKFVDADAGKGTDHVFGKPVTEIVSSSRRIILAIDGESDLYQSITGEKEAGVMIIPISYIDSSDLWIPSPVAAVVPRANNVESIEVEGKTLTLFESKNFVVLPKLLERSAQVFGPQALQDAIRDIQEEATVTIGALVALNCKNVGNISLPPSPKLNKKRISSGKEPFYEYRVLDIFLPDARALPSGGGRRRIAVEQALRQTLRLRAVRGHFKRRKTGIFWWRLHTRGTQAQGLIEKDYRVKQKGKV